MSDERPETIDFQVARGDLRSCRVVRGEAGGIGAGQALLRIDRFALTANNITYATLGDALSYWQFFAAPDGWGRIPVWGFADVIASRHEAVRAGERVFGYLPMSTHVVVQVQPLGAHGFVDEADHRRALPAIYNQYLRARASDSGRDEALQMLLRPLFFAAFLLDDWLADHDFFGARTVVVSSASSKTARAFSRLLARRQICRVVGLTAPGHVALVEQLGGYDQVLAYDAARALPLDRPLAFVDIAGNEPLRRAIHAHAGRQLVHSCIVGSTHAPSLEPRRSDQPLDGPPPVPFFGPAQLEKRNRQWGPAGVQERLAAAWRELAVPIGGAMQIRESRGASAVERVYREVLEGKSRPDEGHLLSLFE